MTPETIGHYRITARIGAGGMGEVYRARDTKLGRDVAIKVLPPAFAEDANRMARFEREARVLASLNHPNIAQIYGVEEHALVMELVEGESPKGPMPFDDAWKIAMQIADALEYAHDKGVVHRDLKPANVKVTPEGTVKLLDFGLAKAYSDQPDPASGDPSLSPTVTLGATVAGTIMGTAAYMSPEQARGKPVDKRADIWSWGVVLFEVLTGEQMFQGEGISDTLAQVLTNEPDLNRVPVQARKLLGTCLAKDPKKRLRDIGDAHQLVVEGGSGVPRKPVSQHSRIAWVLAGALLAAFVTLAVERFREPPAAGRVLRYTIAAPENTSDLQSFAISPDGRLLAVAANVNGKRQLWLRALDALQAQPLPETRGATYPFWSPDSRYIGFFADGKLRKIAASGGPPQTLCNAPNGRGGSWNRDGVIVFSPDGAGGVAIQRVSAAGGVPAKIFKTRGSSKNPVFLPDGAHFLYVNGASGEKNGVYVASLDGKENRRILPDEAGAVYAAGRLLFIRDNTLMGEPFDPATAQPSGDAFPVAEGVAPTSNLTYAPVTVSENGILVYQSGGVVSRLNQLSWYDRGGKIQGTVGTPGPVWDPAISPDAKSVVFRRGPYSGSDLWLWDVGRGTDQRFTTDALTNQAPFWSPHGDRILFEWNPLRGTFNLYEKSASGTGPDGPLLASPLPEVPAQWSHDGRFIVYHQLDPSTNWDIWVLPADSTDERKPIPVLNSRFNELFGQISPNGRWMAYTSDESGRREVYVRPFPAGAGQWRISIAGGEQPRWRGDGKELFFVGADGKLMAAAIETSTDAKSSLEPGAPEALFQANLARSGDDVLFEYDVTADGKRFVLDKTVGSNTSAPVLNVEVNWDGGKKK